MHAPATFSKAARPGVARSSSHQTRLFLGGAVALVLVMLFMDGANRFSMIRRATAMRLAETVPGTVPVAPGARERTQIIPTSGIDGKWWVMHTEQMLREGALRVRHTPLENSPAGREIHWSSGLMWLLVVMAWVRHLFNGQPVADCVAPASLFAGPLLLVVGLGVYGLILARRYGRTTAAAGVLFFGTSFPIFEYFRLGDCDHHGLVGWFGMIGVLCLAAGGAGAVTAPSRRGKAAVETEGFLPEAAARRWFVWGGVAGAAGLWVSAATEIPVLVGTALGALAAGWVAGRWGGATLCPELWRLWGKAGCLTALGFYALEYFPAHLGWRLEVNHPLHALAWLGGGEIVCRLQRRMTGGRLVEKTGADGLRLLGALLVLAAPAVLVALRSGQVFWVADHFLLRLHNEHIREFRPFFQAIKSSNLFLMLAHGLVWPVLGLTGLGVLFARRRVPPAWMAPLVLTVLPCLVMLALAMKQIRWTGISLGLWTLLATLLVALVTSGELRLPLGRWPVRAWGALALLPILLHPALAVGTWAGSFAAPERLLKDIVPNVIARDITHRLVEANADRLPVILSGPTTSTEFAYYGGVRVVGTLYWENLPGLKAAARIFSATSADQARALLARHEVTHVLLFSWDEFSKDYRKLFADEPGEEAAKNPADMFVTRLLDGTEIPQWMRPLYYPIPPELGLTGEKVQLFEIRPEQTPFEWALYLGVYHQDAGQYAEAAASFARALALDPRHPEARTGYALACIRAGKLAEAGPAVDRAPPETAPALRRELQEKLNRQKIPTP